MSARRRKAPGSFRTVSSSQRADTGKRPGKVQAEVADDTKDERTPLELAEAKRATRKAEVQKLHDARLALDLEAINELEITHGDSNVAVIRLPYTEGLPAAVACRCPKPAEVKRFRHQITPKHPKDQPDTIAAAEMLAGACLIYPDRETYDRLCLARPGLAGQLSGEAMKLATGKDETEGKG